jgi:poly(hydroxyalkanoate) depolymerase family esterase
VAAVSLLPARPASAGQFLAGALGDRSYRLYVPASYSADRPSPLIVALHGCAQTPEDFATGTRLNDAAEVRGLLVLYPREVPRHNRERCWNWFVPGGRRTGEPAEILSLIDRIGQRHAVDRSRVFVIGFSAGAFMAVVLQCLAPDVVSGIGVAAGGPYRCGEGEGGSLECLRGRRPDGRSAAAACLRAMGPARRPVRASVWQGAGDSVVNPTNLEALAAMLARLDGATGPQVERREGAVHSTYRDGAGRPVFETWLVPEMGHAWSGGDARGSQTYPAGPAATELVLTFLLG